MIESLANGIMATIHNEDIKELGKKSAVDFACAILTQDPVCIFETANDIRKMLWQIPNAIFWDKMHRFMIGTYSDYECQIKMCEKFQIDNKKSKEFIKKQIQIIEKLDFDCKILWFSNLTRAFLLELLDEKEYFKLSFALRAISAEDIEYIRNIVNANDINENSILNLYYQHSLVTKYTPTTSGSISSQYNISELGLKLYKYGVDFNRN